MVLSCINYAKRSFKTERFSIFFLSYARVSDCHYSVVAFKEKKSDVLLCIPEAGVTVSFGTAPNNGCMPPHPPFGDRGGMNIQQWYLEI